MGGALGGFLEASGSKMPRHLARGRFWGSLGSPAQASWELPGSYLGLPGRLVGALWEHPSRARPWRRGCH
eukprot:8289351-Pyramimonas_sp.AAC.1